MIELIRRAAEANPDHPAVVTSDRTVTYGELLAAAQSVATHLVQRDITRLAILEDDPATAIALLAGCAWAGVESCCYPLAANPELIESNRIAFDHAVLITSRPEWTDDGVIRSADLTASATSPAPPTATTAPLLVLTSGTTTGRPRAARHDWAALTAPSKSVRPTPEQKWLLSYGLNQFGGLQVLLHVFAAGATVHVAESFQPRDAAPAMARWQITHASGTPTFWRFALLELGRTDEPAPPLKQVTLSGEPVPGDVLEQIRATFTDAHVSQVYAATEFGAAITVSDGLPGIPLAKLTGHDVIQFEVRDDELWVRSSSATTGYHGEQTQAAGDWRPTGDLVEIVGDRVQFRGRATEVINVGGVKVHPVPIEDRARAVPGVVLVRAYGRPNAMVGAIVALDVVLADDADAAEVSKAIRTACADLPPAWRPRSINTVEDLPINGNKISRGATTA